MATSEGHDRAGIPPAPNTWPWDRIGLGGWVRRSARTMTGLALVVVLVWDASDTSRTVDQAIAAGASAIQVIQLYTPHVYTAIVAIGVAFGLYVITRGWDHIS